MKILARLSYQKTKILAFQIGLFAVVFSVCKYCKTLMGCDKYQNTISVLANFTITCIAELLIVHLIAIAIEKKSRIFSYVFKSLLVFIILIEYSVFLISGSFLNNQMVESIPYFYALGSKAKFYLTVIFFLVTISLLPTHRLSQTNFESSASLKFLIFYVLIFDIAISPTVSAFSLIGDLVNSHIYISSLKNEDNGQIYKEFYKSGIHTGSKNYKFKVPQNPNIIILFSEGISAEIIDNYAGREVSITPNLDDFYDKSMVFKNYFNHTSPTFRALRGQLASAHLYNCDYNEIIHSEMKEIQKKTSSRLIFLPTILRNKGYEVSWINNEPNVPQFASLLNTFGFTSLISGNIYDRWYTDKESFDYLFDFVERKTNTDKTPFCIMMHNTGTHFGGTKLPNNFYNFDYEFGLFFKKLEAQSWSRNTIFIFTTDHATFPLPDYKKAINSDQKYFIAQIPLIVWWKGIQHDIIDVNGRNSLCFSPTLLDLLNIDQEKNYFLGTSLFTDSKNEFDTISELKEDYYCTSNGKVYILEPGEFDKTIEKIKRFHVISS
jgi:hypothetical protein